MFTKNTLPEQWLRQKADVVPEEGGKYELYWQPHTPEINRMSGCKILAIERPDFVNVEWKGPKSMPHL